MMQFSYKHCESSQMFKKNYTFITLYFVVYYLGSSLKKIIN